MQKLFAIIVFQSLLMLFVSTSAHAQERNDLMIGTFHSSKGFGICVEPVVDSLNFDSLTLYADMYGVLTGDHSTPGFKATYSRNMIFKKYEKEDYTISLYGGPGLAAGYVRDINAPTSFVAGIHGTIGALFTFKRNICVSAGFSSDLAFKLNRNNRNKSLEFSLYRSGIYHIVYPEVRIQLSL